MTDPRAGPVDPDDEREKDGGSERAARPGGYRVTLS